MHLNESYKGKSVPLQPNMTRMAPQGSFFEECKSPLTDAFGPEPAALFSPRPYVDHSRTRRATLASNDMEPEHKKMRTETDSLREADDIQKCDEETSGRGMLQEPVSI